MDWDEVGVNHSTDKSSIGHDYLRQYQSRLEGRRIRRVLEIGVDVGNSLRTWCEVFPTAEVVGLDIRPECADMDVGRATVLITDATQMETVPLLRRRKFDLIIDDGSHQIADVLMTIWLLLPLLSSGGTYIVEDIVGGGPDTPLAQLLSFLAQRPDIKEIESFRSAANWGNTWPTATLGRKV